MQKLRVESNLWNNNYISKFRNSEMGQGIQEWTK